MTHPGLENVAENYFDQGLLEFWKRAFLCINVHFSTILSMTKIDHSFVMTKIHIIKFLSTHTKVFLKANFFPHLVQKELKQYKPMFFLNNLIHIQLYIQAIRQYQRHAKARGGAITFESKKKFGPEDCWKWFNNNNGTAQGGYMCGLTMKLMYFWILHWNIKETHVKFYDTACPQCSLRVDVHLSSTLM